MLGYDNSCEGDFCAAEGWTAEFEESDLDALFNFEDEAKTIVADETRKDTPQQMFEEAVRHANLGDFQQASVFMKAAALAAPTVVDYETNLAVALMDWGRTTTSWGIMKASAKTFSEALARMARGGGGDMKHAQSNINSLKNTIKHYFPNKPCEWTNVCPESTAKFSDDFAGPDSGGATFSDDSANTGYDADADADADEM